MFRRTISAAQIAGTLFKPQVKKPRKGVGSFNKFRSKVSDNVPWYDKGPVEWIPRPVRLPYSTIDEAREWVMRQQLDGNHEPFNVMRKMMQEWSQHPKLPVLGDIEPKFPRGYFKRSHKIHQKFQYRWHKANSPNNWLWLPREGTDPLHWSSPVEYPENWKTLRDAYKVSAQARAATAAAATAMPERDRPLR